LAVFGESHAATLKPSVSPVSHQLTLRSIEDNILITPTGTENLSPAVKDVAEMEKIISQS